MKIVHVVDSMEVGGAEVLVAQMCKLQRELGHDPSVLAVAALGEIGAQLQREGFQVQAEVGRHLSDATRNFYQIFKSLRPDAVHLHNPTPTIYAAAPARLAGARGIVSTRHSLIAPPRRIAEESKYAVASLFCNTIVGICEATTANLRSIHTVRPGKILRVYNGVIPLRRVAKTECPPKDGFTLVYVGRLQPVKNHGLLLRAFRASVSSNADLRLWMVGDGSERKPLENLANELGIAEKVTFWGHKPDVAPYFSCADAFVMSSKSEGLPLSLLQGFSLGIPAIVTDVGGMAEVVRLANAGLIVSPADPNDMAGAMLNMANDEAKRKQYSEAAIDAFHAQFSLETMVDAYLRLYRRGASA